MRGNRAEHIKREITFINYVRDRKQAQLYIMETRQSTGAKGSEYTITLIGQQEFESINDTIVYISKASDTDEMVRDKLVKLLKHGLMRYVEKTPLADYITLSYNYKSKPTDVIDKWDYWVFSTRFNYDMSKRSSRNEFSINGSFSADRVTPELKTSFYIGSDYDREKYIFSSGETYTSISRSHRLTGLIVKSIGEHWSVGGFSSINSSYYSNTKFAFEIAPAFEFNIFPYSVSTRREFRLLYKAAYRNVYYEEETIYFKTHENLFYESLSASFQLKERWGSLWASMEGSHYFHDFSKLNLDFSCNLNLRLFEGLSMDIRGGYSAIRDQLALRKGGATETEIFLHQKEIAENYRLSTEIGFRYTFGSIYSNVVNPRFGNGGRHHRR
ncbi:MAG: hypothetical protein J7L89_06540 [Bacteroidales bacterium]|nr:hypothetical protein [Bacteroidales bacterium]